jgi:hypothetical protein
VPVLLDIGPSRKDAINLFRAIYRVGASSPAKFGLEFFY